VCLCVCMRQRNGKPIRPPDTAGFLYALLRTHTHAHQQTNNKLYHKMHADPQKHTCAQTQIENDASSIIHDCFSVYSSRRTSYFNSKNDIRRDSFAHHKFVRARHEATPLKGCANRTVHLILHELSTHVFLRVSMHFVV